MRNRQRAQNVPEPNRPTEEPAMSLTATPQPTDDAPDALDAAKVVQRSINEIARAVEPWRSTPTERTRDRLQTRASSIAHAATESRQAAARCEAAARTFEQAQESIDALWQGILRAKRDIGDLLASIGVSLPSNEVLNEELDRLRAEAEQGKQLARDAAAAVEATAAHLKAAGEELRYHAAALPSIDVGRRAQRVIEELQSDKGAIRKLLDDLKGEAKGPSLPAA